MERLHQKYKDIVEFRMVYINEAHAADSEWSVDYAAPKKLTEHDDFPERCTAAALLLDEQHLSIPCLVDGMDNAVNEAYRAWPDRIFVVRSDGRLAVAAAPGPWGFKPALDSVAAWLKQLRESGAEPALPESAAEAGEPVHVETQAELDRRAKNSDDVKDSDGTPPPLPPPSGGKIGG